MVSRGVCELDEHGEAARDMKAHALAEKEQQREAHVLTPACLELAC